MVLPQSRSFSVHHNFMYLKHNTSPIRTRVHWTEQRLGLDSRLCEDLGTGFLFPWRGHTRGLAMQSEYMELDLYIKPGSSALAKRTGNTKIISQYYVF